MNTEIKYALLKVIPFLIILFFIKLAIRRKRFSSNDLFIQRPVTYRQSLIWWGLYLLFIILTELLLFKTGILELTHWKHNLISSIIIITGIIILAPVAEELVFRGLFLYKLTQWKINKHLAILIQASVFVMLHSFVYKNTLSSNVGIVQVFIDAILYAYAKYNTKSIYTPIAMHSTGNLIAILEHFIL